MRPLLPESDDHLGDSFWKVFGKWLLCAPMAWVLWGGAALCFAWLCSVIPGCDDLIYELAPRDLPQVP